MCCGICSLNWTRSCDDYDARQTGAARSVRASKTEWRIELSEGQGDGQAGGQECSQEDGQASFAWYELLTTNAAAARAFYTFVVGWEAQDASTSAFSYAVLSAAKTEIGGLMELPPDARRMGATPRWVGYVAVKDIDD